MKATTRAVKTARLDDRWQTFIAFWFLAAVALLVMAVATFIAVAHSHRLAFVLLASGVISLTIGLLIRRAGRGTQTRQQA